MTTQTLIETLTAILRTRPLTASEWEALRIAVAASQNSVNG